MESIDILKIAANALNDKKAKDLKILKVDALTSLAEYFLLSTALSSTHVRSLSDEVEEKLKNVGVLPHHIEGKSTGWYVLDYGSVVINVFTSAEREFYDLDRMWADAEEIDLSGILTESTED